MNTPIISLMRSLTIVLAVMLLGACTKNVKKDDSAGGYAGAEDQIISYELPGRDGFNPDNADYQTLSNFTLYFEFDSYNIRPSERPKMESVASWLNNHPGARVVMAGHTDERGTTQYNLGLGERRALAARDYLLGLGVDAARISTISYGEERPARTGGGEAAWAANRRVQVGVAR